MMRSREREERKTTLTIKKFGSTLRVRGVASSAWSRKRAGVSIVTADALLLASRSISAPTEEAAVQITSFAREQNACSPLAYSSSVLAMFWAVITGLEGADSSASVKCPLNVRMAWIVCDAAVCRGAAAGLDEAAAVCREAAAAGLDEAAAVCREAAAAGLDEAAAVCRLGTRCSVSRVRKS